MTLNLVALLHALPWVPVMLASWRQASFRSVLQASYLATSMPTHMASPQVHH